MGLTKRSESTIIYLQAKHFCLWQESKTRGEDTEAIEVTNPRTGEKITKHGYRFDTVTGRAVELAKYDTGSKYNERYFGFKLHLVDGIDRYVIDLPYRSTILRRFLRVAPTLDWSKPFSITVFKGKPRKGDNDVTGIWFQQNGATVKPHFTREEPHGMPDARYDEATQEWDFRAQHRWLVTRLEEDTGPAITLAAGTVKLASGGHTPAVAADASPREDEPAIDDDDVPF